MMGDIGVMIFVFILYILMIGLCEGKICFGDCIVMVGVVIGWGFVVQVW